MQELHVGPTCEGGCPFSHFDSSHLYNMLKTEDIEERHSEILDLSSQGKYTDACELYLSEKLKVCTIIVLKIFSRSQIKNILSLCLDIEYAG